MRRTDWGSLSRNAGRCGCSSDAMAFSGGRQGAQRRFGCEFPVVKLQFAEMRAIIQKRLLALRGELEEVTVLFDVSVNQQLIGLPSIVTIEPNRTLDRLEDGQFFVGQHDRSIAPLKLVVRALLLPLRLALQQQQTASGSKVVPAYFPGNARISHGFAI
jgi:hypothetical protein